MTRFLPVPADPSGNSPIFAQFSVKNITGLPEDWTVTLYDTGKATMVRITAHEITPTAGTIPKKPYVILLSSEMKSNTVIDTQEPIKKQCPVPPGQGPPAGFLHS